MSSDFSITSQCNRLLVITEQYLNEWVLRSIHEKRHLSGLKIRQLAHTVCIMLLWHARKDLTIPILNAFVGQLAAIKKYEIKFTNYKGESGSANAEAAGWYHPIFQKVVRHDRYGMEQIFNFDETGLSWKQSPKTTFTAKEEMQARGLKMSKERITVLFIFNATGDSKMKPVGVHRSHMSQTLLACQYVEIECVLGIW